MSTPTSLELDAALDAIELIGWALAVVSVPSDAPREAIRREALQLAQYLLDRNRRDAPWLKGLAVALRTRARRGPR